MPEQPNVKFVTLACRLIDGCSLKLCVATYSIEVQVRVGLAISHHVITRPGVFKSSLLLLVVVGM